jgi:hypothetical protein
LSVKRQKNKDFPPAGAQSDAALCSSFENVCVSVWSISRRYKCLQRFICTYAALRHVKPSEYEISTTTRSHVHTHTHTHTRALTHTHTHWPAVPLNLLTATPLPLPHAHLLTSHVPKPPPHRRPSQRPVYIPWHVLPQRFHIMSHICHCTPYTLILGLRTRRLSLERGLCPPSDACAQAA